MVTSLSNATAVEARMKGGYAQSKVPFVAIIVNLFFKSAILVSYKLPIKKPII
jgi:hypothetical protein